MDHGDMGHGDMGHGDMGHDHSGHGDMGGMGKCSMNMIFTWSSENLCIIFSQWRVTSTFSLLWSLVAIMILTAGYEYVRDITRKYEYNHSTRMAAFGTGASSGDVGPERSSSLVVGRDSKESTERTGKLVRAGLYALQVFYSFFIMLLFMTYNGWVMLSVAVGAFIGHIAFGSDLPAAKSVACH